MASGKELARLLTCGIWKEEIKTIKGYRLAQIFDREGYPITHKQAEIKKFCHLKVLFYDLTKTEVRLITCILQIVASTSSEHMSKEIFNYYGKFHEIIIC